MDALEETLTGWLREKGWRKAERTLSESASSLGTDTVTLFHYFERHKGLDFRTWRTRLRLEDAKRLLVEEPSLTAADIARTVGFSNRSNFSRHFLAYTGRTPGQWREEASGD